MKFKLKRAKGTTTHRVSETINLIVRFTEAVETNVKEGTLAKIAACLSEADAQALNDVLMPIPCPWRYSYCLSFPLSGMRPAVRTITTMSSAHTAKH